MGQVASVVSIGSVKGVLYLRTELKFCPYNLHLLFYLDQNQ